MTESQIQEIVKQALGNIAPEVDLDAIDPEKTFASKWTSTRWIF